MISYMNFKLSYFRKSYYSNCCWDIIAQSGTTLRLMLFYDILQLCPGITESLRHRLPCININSLLPHQLKYGEKEVYNYDEVYPY